MNKTKRLYIDYSVCIGCETCEAVCSFLYNAPRIHMVRTSEGLMAPVYCRHCRKPACVRACPADALTKLPDGTVQLNPLACVECRSIACFSACPFGAMFCSSKGAPVYKCDLCAKRRERGLEPACMEMCPAGAIKFVTESEIADLQDKISMEIGKMVICHINVRPEKGEGGE